MSFDRLAPHYRWMEVILAGEKLQRCRTAFLPCVGNAKSVLILGEGNGRFLTAFLKSNSIARVTCIDASPTMLELARTRITRAGCDADRVKFIHADALSLRPDLGEFDLIVTHFFLDCFRSEQLDHLIRTLTNSALPDAQWLLADFHQPERGWRKWRAGAILASMYAFFRVATRLPANHLVAPDAFLNANGFHLVERRESELGLLRTDRWQKVSADRRSRSDAALHPAVHLARISPEHVFEGGLAAR